MNLVNDTKMVAGLTIATDRDGFEVLVVVVKGTFDVHSDVGAELAEDQQPLIYADVPHGEPGQSSVRYESDFAPFKRLADVILLGKAYAVNGNLARSTEVRLSVSSIDKTVRVFGDRRWDWHLLGGYEMTEPEPFEAIPLLYERAFGGVDHDAERGITSPFPSNLVGVGYHKTLHDGVKFSRLPNFEDPRHMVGTPLATAPVAGFGFVSRNWQPRLSHAGTYDQQWLDEQFPYLPTDFDDRHYQSAPVDQQCAYFEGGEEARITNCTPDGFFRCNIPRMTVGVTVVSAGEQRDLMPVMDTLVIEPEQCRITVTWRASHVIDTKLTNIHEVQVYEPTPGRLRAKVTGKRYIGRSANRGSA